MLDKSSSEKPMSIAAEMKEAIVMLAGPRGWHDNRKSWLDKAARAAGITSRQARTFFYAECRNPSSKLVEQVRAALRKRQSETLREARNAYDELTQSIQRAECALRVSSENVGCVEVDALREVLGRKNRPVGGGVKQQ